MVAAAMPMTRQRAARCGGFTIIELMLTIVIASILVSLAAPSFRNMIVSTRIKSATSDIYTILLFARSEAIKRNASVDIVPVSGHWTNGLQVKYGTTVLRSQDAFPNLKIECPAGTDCVSTLTYARNGRLTATATFAINDFDATTPPKVPQRCINVNVSGKPSVTADNNLDGDCSNG